MKAPAHTPQNNSSSTRAATKLNEAPRSRSLPPLLRLLLWVQRGSCVVAFSSIGTVLASYAATVYLQQQWSESYKTLERLQRETRNLTAADETLKHQLAKQAQEQEEGFTFPSPQQTIYLSPSSEKIVDTPMRNEIIPTPSPSNVPLGY
ncbi:MAG: hypothetical protein SVX43_08140 [Cyanobacteriota bacterium]|nr:hypothetical protein [Cyanobacteriota bacterium]